jgi:hypothetical protein
VKEEKEEEEEEGRKRERGAGSKSFVVALVTRHLLHLMSFTNGRDVVVVNSVLLARLYIAVGSKYSAAAKRP